MRTYKTTEAQRAAGKRWCAANKERKKQYDAEYKRLHPNAAKEYAKSRRKNDPEKMRAYQNRWNKENPEKVKARSEKYRNSHRAEINRKSLEAYYANNGKELSKQRRLANPKKAAEALRKWQSKNHVYTAEAAARRRAMIGLACPPWADMEIIELVYAEAKYRGHSVDHVIPIHHKLVCGLHVHTNMRLITKRENSSKGNKFTPIALP